MVSEMASKSLIAPALAEVAVIIYRDVKNGSAQNNPVPHLPLPASITSVVIVYGILSLLPESWESATVLMGWGLVVATLLNAFTPRPLNTENTSLGTIQVSS